MQHSVSERCVLGQNLRNAATWRITRRCTPSIGTQVSGIGLPDRGTSCWENPTRRTGMATVRRCVPLMPLFARRQYRPLALLGTFPAEDGISTRTLTDGGTLCGVPELTCRYGTRHRGTEHRLPQQLYALPFRVVLTVECKPSADLRRISARNKRPTALCWSRFILLF